MAYLTVAKQRQIDQVIRGIYLATNKKYPDFGLIDILRVYGVDVAEYDFGTDSADIMGAIKFAEPEKGVERPVILINKDKPIENKTFTLAHEFGHYMLHKKEGVKFRLDTYDYSSDSAAILEESEANYFAGSILMPRDELIELVNTTSNLDEVAKYFGVSRKALDVRLAWIKSN
jgi:Zn-dependent peptidase ImmA (M78 family)